MDSAPGSREATPKIFVKVLPEGLEVPLHVQLDTGAPWSLVDPETADAMGVAERLGERVTLRTPLGSRDGKLVRTRITILADEGDSLEVEATVFVPDEWPPGLNFAGYGGLLQHMRFGVDPSANHFYFGPPPSL